MYTFTELYLMHDRNQKQSNYINARENADDAVDVARGFRNLNARLVAKNQLLEEEKANLEDENELLKALVASMLN